MSEVHTTITGSRNEVTVVCHNPGISPLPKNAGVPIAVTKDSSGKTTSTSGQVPGGSVVHTNPA
jgi:hypothetical protein